MPANGTAIKAGCVTRLHRAVSCPGRPARLSRCEEGMARVFALMLQVLLSYLCVGGTMPIGGCDVVTVVEVWQMGTGAVSRYKLEPEQVFCPGAET